MPPIPQRDLKFAVVREDPRIEEGIVAELRPQRVLLVASGGCTALHLRARFPDVELTLVEPNPAQIDHVRAKLAALADSDTRRFNVGTDDPRALHECGAFEHVFRLFRDVLDLFVVSRDERLSLCADPRSDWGAVVAHPYWSVAFATAFSDEILTATFGSAALQHAAPGSYPRYFRERIEAGLAADDRGTNPWLHHVLLGQYLHDPRAWPPFLRDPPRDLSEFEVVRTDLLGIEDFRRFDLVCLSNVPDWMDERGFRELVARLGDELAPGAAVLWRQLNDPRPLAESFRAAFSGDAARDVEMTHAERSLFYDRVHLVRHL